MSLYLGLGDSTALAKKEGDRPLDPSDGESAMRTRMLILVLLLNGCTTYTSHTGVLRQSLVDGDYEAAALSLDRFRKGPNRLLYLLENGLVSHYRGEYDRSNRYFEAAERLADRLFTKSLTRELVSFVTNDAVRALQR